MNPRLLLLFILVSSVFAMNLHAQNLPPYYEQMEPYDVGYSASFYSPEPSDGPASRYQVADNFIVPPDELWELTEIEVYGDDFGIDILFFDLFIYYPTLDDFSVTAPGEIYHTQAQLEFQKTGESPSLFKIFLNSQINLPPGEYWLSIVAQPDWPIDGDPAGGFGWRKFASPQDNPDFLAYESTPPVPFEWMPVQSDFTFRLNRPVRIPLSSYSLIIGIGLIMLLTAFSFRRYFR